MYMNEKAVSLSELKTVMASLKNYIDNNNENVNNGDISVTVNGEEMVIG